MNDSIPAEWEFPIASPTIIYWRGIDHLAPQWEQTKMLGAEGGTIEELHEYLFWRKTLVIWTCCAIEAFVNEEGVSWLGDSFYKKNLERLGICEKIAVLYALKYAKRLQEDHAVLKDVKKVFDFRNQLVHPKARSFKKNPDPSDSLRSHLDSVEPDLCRKLFRAVATLFKERGIGEPEEKEKE